MYKYSELTIRKINISIMEITLLSVIPRLQPYIAHAYLIAHRNDEEVEYSMLPRIFPTFLFILNESGSIYCEVNGFKYLLQPGQIYYAGMGTGAASLHCSSMIRVIVVSLYPYCVPLFFRDDAPHFLETCFNLIEADIKNTEPITESIFTSNDSIRHWHQVQHFFIRQLSGGNNSNCFCYAREAVQLIAANNGMLEIEKIVPQVFTGIKNLQRSFKQHIGMSPKKFSEVVRFNSFVSKHLHDGLYQSLFETAMEFNYYDLSHLDKEFVRFTGLSPKTFFQQETIDEPQKIVTSARQGNFKTMVRINSKRFFFLCLLNPQAIKISFTLSRQKIQETKFICFRD